MDDPGGDTTEGTPAGDATAEGTPGDSTHAEGTVVGDGEKVGDGEELAGEHMEGEHIEGEHVPKKEIEGIEGEEIEGEYLEGEQLEGEHIEGEHVPKKKKKKKKKQVEKEQLVEGEHMGEEMLGEHEEKEGEKPQEEEHVEEEEQFVEEPPPDPAAPFNFTDSQEAIKPAFSLREDQLAEVEQLWAVFQDYTPAYTDIDNYITEKELIYMLKSLNLMTYTPEQLDELVAFCVRPPHPEGHITFEQFLWMVTMRQRDFPIEEELRSALQVFDPEKTGSLDRDSFRENLLKTGHKMPPKLVELLIKEVDMSNDGTLGVDDIIGTMCIDLNTEDIIMLRNTLDPSSAPPPADDEDA